MREYAKSLDATGISLGSVVGENNNAVVLLKKLAEGTNLSKKEFDELANSLNRTDFEGRLNK
jgi:hypothetical protein